MAKTNKKSKTPEPIRPTYIYEVLVLRDSLGQLAREIEAHDGVDVPNIWDAVSALEAEVFEVIRQKYVTEMEAA